MIKKLTSKRKPLFAGLFALVFILPLFCTGCGRPRGELFPSLDVSLVWPGPPEKPRIRYVGAISTEADLKREVSWSEGLGEVFFGKRKTGVLLAPYAIAVDRNDRIFVTDVAGAVVHIFDLNTREYKQFGDIAEDEKLLNPVGLTVVDNQIYVVDSTLGKVCVFDRDGKLIFSFGGDQLERPSGIAYGPEWQTIYVTDTANHTINVFSKDGRFVHRIGSRGLKPSLFNFPTHLWFDQSEKLYVSDTLNYRIQVFSNEGSFLRMFGRQGDRPGYFAHPCGVATDSFGHIYVTDRQFENIQIFDSDGQILMAFGKEGTSAGEFWLPAGIFIDNSNRIYVADSYNKRVQIFELLEQTKQ
ncbi:MAG: 6-bladed beta-propeller [Planctomycetota bacterium]|jgi:DNA-binding beta-propeller fold protein YncE